MKNKVFLSAVAVLVLGTVSLVSLAPAVSAEGLANSDDFSKSFNKFKEEKKNLEKFQSGFIGSRQGSAYQSQLLEKNRLVLERAIGTMEKRLTQLEDRIQSRENVYEGIAVGLLNEIQNNLGTLAQVRTRLGTASTTDILKIIAGELKTYRQGEKNVLRKLIVLSHVGQFENSIIKAAENRSQRIAERIADLKSDGKNVAELENLLNQANQKIAQAKTKLGELKSQINSGGIDISDLSEIQKKLNEIKNLIKETYSLFREIAVKGNELFGRNNNKNDDNTATSTATSTDDGDD